MDLSIELEKQAFEDDVKLGFENPGIKCATLQDRIAGILENIKVTVHGYAQDEYGAPEGGWATPVMERVREIANGPF